MVMMMENVKIRVDINDMVDSIKLQKVKTRYNERNVCQVKFFNGVKVEFKDSEGLYDLLCNLKACGKDATKLIKSRKLVEEEKTASLIIDGDDENSKTYFCVLYELEDGKAFRLFLARPYVDKLAIEAVYEKYKEQQAKAKSTSQVK